MKAAIGIFLALLVCCTIASHSSSDSSDSSDSSSSSSSSEKKIKYSYTLWIGNGVKSKSSINLKSSAGVFFYDSMVQAAAKDKHFAFDTIEFPPNGRFVNQIGGFATSTVT